MYVISRFWYIFPYWWLVAVVREERLVFEFEGLYSSFGLRQLLQVDYSDSGLILSQIVWQKFCIIQQQKYNQVLILLISYQIYIFIIVMDSDYQVVKRTADQSGKYAWIKEVQPDVDLDKAIVVSHADMQFKFSPQIYQKFLEKTSNIHLGYPNLKKSFWCALQNWIHTRYCPQALINENTTMAWSNTITALHGAIENTTQPNDEVLIICPVYYFFLLVSKFKDRKMVEFLLDEKDNRFYIDFQKLEDTLKKNKIKLFIFCSPWNPCGRIWGKQQLTKLAHLVTKYKFYLISDQIYSDSIEPTPQQQQQSLTTLSLFTSMLTFPQIYPYLIYINSYTKAFNSSGLALSYSVCYNSELNKKMNTYRILSGGMNNALSAVMLEVIYTSPQATQWKKNTIAYIFQNYLYFKSECKTKLPSLIIYDLQCSYLCLIDFREYKLMGKELKRRFTKVQVCPTFMEASYVTVGERSIVRINLAANRAVIGELVGRMKDMLELE